MKLRVKSAIGHDEDDGLTRAAARLANGGTVIAILELEAAVIEVTPEGEQQTVVAYAISSEAILDDEAEKTVREVLETSRHARLGIAPLPF